MKYLLIFLFTLQSIYAKESMLYETSLYTGTLFLFLLMLAIIIVQMRRSSADKEALKEKAAKIDWLRQVRVEDQQRYTKEIQALEKEILALTHTVERLEMKLAEGTKNQVLEKIEALEKRRQAAAQR